MTCKYTPGPWEVDSRSSLCVNAMRDGITASICSTGGYSASWRDGEELDLENQANAHLIAAAPELLEALVATKNWIEIMYPEGAYAPGINKLMDKSDAAIAKAQGKANDRQAPF